MRNVSQPHPAGPEVQQTQAMSNDVEQQSKSGAREWQRRPGNLQQVDVPKQNLRCGQTFCQPARDVAKCFLELLTSTGVFTASINVKIWPNVLKASG